MDKKNYKIWWHWNWRIQNSSTESPISINDVDINEIVISNKFPFGQQDFKYFIGYKDNKEIRTLYICYRNDCI